MTLNLQISLPLRVICQQCGQDMKLEGAQVMNPSPTLKCPECGLKIRLEQGAPAQPLSGIGKRMPEFRPQPKT